MNSSTNLQASGANSVMGASLLIDPDKLAQREAAVKKKEKDLQLKDKDLERRKGTIEEIEDKQGTIAQREQAAQEIEAANSAALRDLKKREKIVKENELKAEASQAALDAMEQRLTQRDADIDAKAKRNDQVKSANEKLEAVLEAREAVVREREARAMDVELANRSRTTELNRFKEALDTRAAELALAEAALQAAQKELKRRSDAVDKEALQAREKVLALQAKENDVVKEREAVKVARQQVTMDDKQARSDRQAAEAVIAESKRRCDMAEALEATAKRRKEDAEHSVAALDEEKAKIARARADVAVQEDSVRRLESQCRKSEEDVATREKAIFAEQRELKAREKHLSAQLAILEESEALLETRKRELDDRTDAVIARERSVTDRESLATAQLREAGLRMANTERRQAALDTKEKELVDWMKEMTWREMMLGEQEAIVRRQPVVPIAAAGKHPVSTQGESSGSPFPPGFGHRAFGHAVVEVQFRRLKDQYVSAQMKHARDQLAYEEELKRSVAQHRSRRPRAGIATSQRLGDLSEEADQIGGIGELEKSVHKMSIAFIRKMAKYRAFDGFESPLSPEKLTQLDQFAPSERSVLTTAANLEYVLKSVQSFVCAMQTCPLDHKDKATDVQDLVDRMSKWWVIAKQSARDTLQQLLADRKQYLSQALGVLPNNQVQASDGVEWPFSAQLVPEDLGDRVGKYCATHSFEHVKESTILAPRGLATLKAVSEAASARDHIEGKRGPLRVPDAPPTRHNAEIPKGPGREIRTESADKADSVFLAMGRLSSAKAKRKGDFSLAAFLEDSAHMPQLQHTSPYKVPPVRPASALAAANAKLVGKASKASTQNV